MCAALRKHDEKRVRTRRLMIYAIKTELLSAFSLGQVVELVEIVNPPSSPITSSRDYAALREANKDVAKKVIHDIGTASLIASEISSHYLRDPAETILMPLYCVRAIDCIPEDVQDLNNFRELWQNVDSLRITPENLELWSRIRNQLFAFVPRSIPVLITPSDRVWTRASMLARTTAYIAALRNSDNVNLARFLSKDHKFHVVGADRNVPNDALRLLQQQQAVFDGLVESSYTDYRRSKRFDPAAPGPIIETRFVAKRQVRSLPYIVDRENELQTLVRDVYIDRHIAAAASCDPGPAPKSRDVRSFGDEPP
jgi:hypothetical protein